MKRMSEEILLNLKMACDVILKLCIFLVVYFVNNYCICLKLVMYINVGVVY